MDTSYVASSTHSDIGLGAILLRPVKAPSPSSQSLVVEAAPGSATLTLPLPSTPRASTPGSSAFATFKPTRSDSSNITNTSTPRKVYQGFPAAMRTGSSPLITSAPTLAEVLSQHFPLVFPTNYVEHQDLNIASRRSSSITGSHPITPRSSNVATSPMSSSFLHPMDPPPRRRHEFAGFEDTELLMKMIPGFTTLKRSRGTRQALVDKAEGADIVQPSSDIVANDEMLLQFGSDDEDESEGEREDEEEVGKGMKRRKISGL